MVRKKKKNVKKRNRNEEEEGIQGKYIQIKQKK